MNKQLGEQISALLDDELAEHEVELLLQRLKQDEDLRSSWMRYQLIGDVLRQRPEQVMTVDLVDRINRELEAEPDEPMHQAARSVKGRFLRPVAGIAVAASVAVMAITGIQRVALENHDGPAVTTRVASSAVSPTQPIQRVAGTRWSQGHPEMEMRLNGYLVNHSEYTSNINLQGMINYARIAGYDAQRR